jgi:hypothetical protein
VYSTIIGYSTITIINTIALAFTFAITITAVAITGAIANTITVAVGSYAITDAFPTHPAITTALVFASCHTNPTIGTITYAIHGSPCTSRITGAIAITFYFKIIQIIYYSIDKINIYCTFINNIIKRRRQKSFAIILWFMYIIINFF